MVLEVLESAVVVYNPGVLILVWVEYGLGVSINGVDILRYKLS